MSDFLIWTISTVVYLFLGFLTGMFFRIFADLGTYANFKVLMITLLWPLAWLVSFALAFWEWVTER